jgi:protocatechuate 3,4-dioxygenase beta subunit
MRQPIETAPRDGTPILLFCPHIPDGERLQGMPNVVVGLWWADEGGWYSDVVRRSGGEVCWEELEPTHWMPLPQQ